MHRDADRDIFASADAGWRTIVYQRLGRYWPEVLGAAAALIVAATFLRAAPCPDVAWQLWIGHHLRQGARFYVDIIESNPPLWFWMAIPIDWIAERIGTTSAITSFVMMGVLSALSVVGVGRLLDHLSAPIRASILVYAAVTLMVIPLREMEQREHILLVCALPYIALAAGRCEGRAISPWLAALVGFGSAFGFGLKHYFLITPALVELWLLASLRRRYRPLRPETILLGLMALAYTCAVLTLTPAYLSDIVPMLRLAYGSLRVHHLSEMIGITQYYWAIMTILLLIRLDLVARTPAAAGFAIAALGFAAAWLIQFKGWANHEDPVTCCLMIAVAMLVTLRWRELSMPVGVAAPTLLTLPLAISLCVGPYRDSSDIFTRPALAGLRPDDSAAFVSENVTYAWPLSLTRGFRYPSRFYTMEFLHALVADHGRTPAITELGQKSVRETAQDYSCIRPVRIIFDEHHRGDFDLEAYFLAQPSFARLMTHYSRIGRYRQLDIFQRVSPFPTPPADACRRGV